MIHASTLPVPAVRGTDRRDRVRPAVGGARPGVAAVAALGTFLAARLCGVLVLAVVARASGKRPLLLLGRSWDSVWYLRIAAHGYGYVQPGPTCVHSDLAFFPLYPGMVRAVTTLTPLPRNSTRSASSHAMAAALEAL